MCLIREAERREAGPRYWSDCSYVTPQLTFLNITWNDVFRRGVGRGGGGGGREYLHDAIPVVAGGDLEEREESHPKVLEGGVAAHSLAGVVSVTH